MNKKINDKNSAVTISRRDFIKYSGLAIAGVCVLGCEIPGGSDTPALGFILVDPKKCQGCISCMLACSLVHEGVINPSLSRIQVMQNTFGKWPDDVILSQCRQCLEPACVPVCPVNAIKRDPRYDNIITINKWQCIGCRRCFAACPYTPGRIIWNVEKQYSQKCDLCATTPYWKEKGGLDGKKACTEVCPMTAIVFTRQIPDQEREDSYFVNLRGDEWGKLGFPTD